MLCCLLKFFQSPGSKKKLMETAEAVNVDLPRDSIHIQYKYKFQASMIRSKNAYIRVIG